MDQSRNKLNPKTRSSNILISFWYLCLFFVFILETSCSNTIYQVPADTVRIRIGVEPPTLNPITASDAYAAQINNYLFESLIDRDRDTLEFKPKIAKSWEISTDKKTYTFHLRNDVKWHDGTPLTADDIIYSFNLLKDPKTNDPALKVYYQDIESVTKLDENTVQFHYTKVYFLGLSVSGSLPLVPQHLVKDYQDFEGSPFSRHPIGNGPYKFKEWVTNTKIILERNEDYWDKKPQIKTIEFKVIPESSIAFQILKKGELDVFELSSIQWAKQSNSPKFNKQFYKFAYPSAGYSYIGWNNLSPLFKDPLVRQAMTHMVNRKQILDKIYFGLGSIVAGPFFPLSKQYNTEIPLLGYDVEKAKNLLKQAGWKDSDGDGVLDKDGKKFEFTFLYPSAARTAERISTILKEDLKKTGIVMNIERIEWAAFLDKIMKKDFDATTLGWSAPFESDPYQVWDMSQADVDGSSNFITFKNTEASELMRQARVEFNETKRNKLYWCFQEILNQQQPYTFLYNTPSLSAVSKRFSNVKVHKVGIDLLEWEVSTQK